MKNSWKQLSSKVVHKNPWFHIQQDKILRPGGKKGEYNIVVTPDSVFVLPVTGKNEVYLIRIYRYPTKSYSWEVPAGSSDHQPPLTAAKRELQEEAGLAARQWKKLGKFQLANGILREVGHLFLARELSTVEPYMQEDEGIVEVARIPFKRALKWVEQGKIIDGPTIVILNMARKFIK